MPCWHVVLPISGREYSQLMSVTWIIQSMLMKWKPRGMEKQISAQCWPNFTRHKAEVCCCCWLLTVVHQSLLVLGGWVHCVAFSPDGTRLAWVSHDSSVSVVDSRKSMHPINVRTTFLPFLSCVWCSDNLLVTAVSFNFITFGEYGMLMQWLKPGSWLLSHALLLRWL